MSEPLHDAVMTALRQVSDPETGRDLVAMGLIYGVTTRGNAVFVTMTTTTRGCPLSEMLRMGAEVAVLAVPGVARAEVSLTWDPPWTPERIEAQAF